MGSKQKCQTCRFWTRLELVGVDAEIISGAVGLCKRTPPSAGVTEHPLSDGGTLQFRASICTYGGNWCGEWQAANPQTVDDAAAVMARHVLAGDAGAARQLADKLIELIPLPVIDIEQQPAG